MPDRERRCGGDRNLRLRLFDEPVAGRPSELSVVPIVIRVASLVPAVSLASAVMTTPGSTADVDHWRRGIVRSRLIDHRRRVSSKDKRVDADTDMYLRACGRGCAKRKSRKDQ
jgi:hypothetical protein